MPLVDLVAAVAVDFVNVVLLRPAAVAGVGRLLPVIAVKWAVTVIRASWPADAVGSGKAPLG